VLAVGERLHDRYRPGQRLAIQPDIHTDGRSTAYGYTIPGGLIQAHLLGPEVLAADDGAYVVEVDDRLGCAEAALTEPWACVEAAYTQRRRLWPKDGGRAWVIGDPDDERPYAFGDLLAGEAAIVLTGVPAAVAAVIRRSAPAAAVSEHPDIDPALGEFDDIVMLAPRSAALVGAAARQLAFRGTLNVVSDIPLEGPVELDLGRIHYHYTAYFGTPGPDVSAAYGEARNRAELRDGGLTLVVGAAGPMGQMHVQRALQMTDGPAVVVGVDLDADRLAAARPRLERLAADAGRRLDLVQLRRDGPSIAEVVRERAGRLADDVVITAPVASAVNDGLAAMAPDGMIVLFAGLPIGTLAPLDLSPVFLHGAQYTGTSGSRIVDQERVIQKTLLGQLSPGHSLAAVGGIEAAADGIRAMMDGTFAGKIVIFPQLRGLPLTALADIATLAPEVADALGHDGVWTSEAEARLFARFGRPPDDEVGAGRDPA
jgi:threonine dehydrogenase-like Zn-dependent dehydrogenase